MHQHDGANVAGSKPLRGQITFQHDEVQLIEVLMVVGHYHLLAMALNSLRVANDDGLDPMPD